jgi:hypothetical protein
MSLHCHVQTASEAHLVSFLMGTGGKWPELEAHNYIQLVPTEKVPKDETDMRTEKL